MSYFQFYHVFFISVGQGFYPTKSQHKKRKKQKNEEKCGRGEIQLEIIKLKL